LRNKSWRFCILGLTATLPIFGQYGGFGGPSILSRGGGPAGRTGSNPVSFRGYVGATGSYSTNLNQFTSSSNGASLLLRDAYSAGGTAGIQGYKSTSRSSTSVDLAVSYNWTQVNQVSQGLSESLGFTHSRQISRRVTWYMGASGQSTNRSIAFANPRYSPEPLPELSPQQEEIFDTRTYRANVGTGFTFQKSPRLSFSGQAGAFGNERKSKFLADSRGFMGGGSVQYALTRRQFVGASFSYGTFYFPGFYGETQFYSPQGYYGVAINKAWTFNLSAGMYSAKTDRLVTVRLDPYIAQLTGQQSLLEVFRGTSRGFSGGVALNGAFRRWGVTLAANRGVMPGNGVYLTSEMTTVTTSVSHTLGRSASFAMYARGAEAKALTQTLGNARYYSAGSSFSYRLNTYLTFSSNLGIYKTQAVGQLIEFNRLTATAGIYFAPGELPVHIF